MNLVNQIKEKFDSMSAIEIDTFVDDNQKELLGLLGEDLDGYSPSEKRDMLAALIKD